MSALFILMPEAVTTAAGGDKVAILARLADVFATVYDLDRDMVLDRLTERERLGSTGFGRNVAIPQSGNKVLFATTIILNSNSSCS